MTGAGLRVGFDYWPAATHGPGVGRYVRELVRALAARADGPELRLLDVGPEGETVDEGSLGLDRGGERVSRVRRRKRRGWLRFSESLLGPCAERKLGPLDVFHRAWPLGAPSARAPQVVALAEPPAGPAEDDALVGSALASMAAVLVFSDHARAEVVRRFALDEARVHRVPAGCDHWVRDKSPRAGAIPRPRLLALGAVRRGRYHAELLATFERLRGSRFQGDIVFCGRRGDLAPQLEALLRVSRLRGEVRWVDEPVESAMPALVRSASVLVHLEDDPWTAVTPLEALSFGAAVVVTRHPCFVEALGDEAEYVEPGPAGADPAVLAAACERALASAQAPAAVERRLALARRFTWEANARATIAVYESVARARAQ